MQTFFDNLVEQPVNPEEKKGLTHETTDRDVAYIASRMEEATAAEAAGEFGYSVEEAEAADAVSRAKEEEILKLLKPAGEPAGRSEATGQGTESSEPAEEDAESGDSDEDSGGSLNLDDVSSSSENSPPPPIPPPHPKKRSARPLTR